MSEPSRPRFEHHTEVAELDDDALVQLLEEGEPPERVWAAWELGLRREETLVDRIRARLDVEPHFGVRRHLAIMLAGFDDVETLRHLAETDENPYVRATTCQYLCQWTDDEGVADLLRRWLASKQTHPLVRAAILCHFPPSVASDEVEVRVETLLDAEDSRVRRAARERYRAHEDD